MKRAFARWLAAGLSLATSAAAQAPVDPSTPMPPGHPEIGADDGDELPPGHPAPTAGAAEPLQDRASPAPELRAGTIEVHIRDASDRPMASVPVRLGVMKQDVAQGDSRSQRDGTTNAAGVVTFDGLSNGSAYSYRVTVDRDGGSFASEPLRLGETGGQRVLLHVYPVTHDIREALVGLRGVLFVQPREDVFQVEANFQVLNIGKLAWVPEHVTLKLPEGAKAFRGAEGMNDTRAERTPSGEVELLGTYSPGQREVGFQFQLDNHHDPSRSLRVGLPPHVAELRIVAEGARGMVLHAEGFPDAEPMQGQDGSRLLVTGRRLARGQPALEDVVIELQNLPVPSMGRWYAVAVALGIAGLGLFLALRRGRTPASGPATTTPEELQEAANLVLDELVALEKLRQAEGVGPRTYQETRSALLDALSRLQVGSPGST